MPPIAVPGSVSALDDETAARGGWLRRKGALAARRTRAAGAAAARRLRPAGVAVAGGLRAAWSYRAVRIASPVVAATLTLWPPLALVHHVYFDRRDLPELAPFVLFQPPTTGEVTDARGEVVIQLAREYRRVVTYDEVPLVVRQAILAAEDKNFHSHSGVDYSALPRVIQKAVARSLAEWWNGSGLRLRLPQGGSTLTQQLVRVYFLPYLTARRDDDALFTRGLTVPRLMASVLGAPAANKLLRKLEEVRLALWLEEAMRREYRTREQAKREIFSRYASFIYMGSGRYGFGAASEYYFDKPLATYTIEDAGRAALLAGIGKSPRVYAPAAGSPRPRERRNQILALMARNGYIAEDLARRCPGRADRRRSPVRPRRPRLPRPSITCWTSSSGTAARSSPSRTCSRAGYGCAPRSISGCRESSTRPSRTASLATRSGIPGRLGSSRARWWSWPTPTRRSSPRRGDGSSTTFAPAATPTTTA